MADAGYKSHSSRSDRPGREFCLQMAKGTGSASWLFQATEPDERFDGTLCWPWGLTGMSLGALPELCVKQEMQFNRPQESGREPRKYVSFFLHQEIIMKGGTKPRTYTKQAEKFQDGAKKSGGMKTTRHAGPKRASKTAPSGTKGLQLEKRSHP